jgi:23S rRNA pseudouridine1911/1915/1917 synthase
MKPRRSQRSHDVRREFVVAAPGGTLAACLKRHLRELSAESAQAAVAVGCVFVDGKRVDDPALEVRAGQRVTANLGRPFERAVLAQTQVSSEPPRHRVLYEDDHLVAVFKPSGLLTAPTPEGRGLDLQSLLATHERKVQTVHRLDLETSGVILFAKSKEANRLLAEIFRTHALVRRYDAFVAPGYPVEAETLQAPIDGRSAITHVRVVARDPRYTRLEATLQTGRTHQIRLHLTRRGFPVLADTKYGERREHAPPRLALHARLLELAHPVTGAPLHFEAELPDDLAHWLA